MTDRLQIFSPTGGKLNLCQVNLPLPPYRLIAVRIKHFYGPPTLPVRLARSFSVLNYTHDSMYISLRRCTEQQTNQAAHAQSATSNLSQKP